MKKIIFLISLFTLAGCSIFQPDESGIIQPQLLKQTALPPIRELYSSDTFEFYCLLIIAETGDVEFARIVSNSGDLVWDSLAAQSILEWKFSPPLKDGEPTQLTILRKFVVNYETPIIVSLAEILVKDHSVADSVYMLLVNGNDFSELALKYSTSNSVEHKGFLGNTDLTQYSKEIRRVLSQLGEDEFTEPLEYGESFVIFKRLKEQY